MRVSNSAQPLYYPEPPVAKEEAGPAFADQLSDDEKKVVHKLKARDTEVRAHERAHAHAGGHMAGSPSYQFQTGPDGQRYAVGGDVSIQMPSSKDPGTRVQEARQVRAAATAPSRPSSQDLKVASAAAKIEAEALAELREEKKLSVCENCGQVHGLDKIKVEVASEQT